MILDLFSLHWIAFPFLRILLCLLAGIVLGLYVPELISGTLCWLLLVIAFAGSLLFMKLRPGRAQIAAGALGLMAVVLTGYGRVVQYDETRRVDHISHVQGRIEGFTIQITNQPSRIGSTRFEGELQSVFVEGKWSNVVGGIQLILRGDSTPYSYGDVLMVKGSPQLVRPPANPGEFDYKTYLKYRNIYYQNRCKASDVVLVKHSGRSAVFECAYMVRQWGEHVLESNIANTQDCAIASALVLGITDDLDRELIAKYASTGVLHVLSVSGLHVGIVFLIISFLLKPIAVTRRGKLIIAVVSIITLWCYAFVTGLSPSVLRAVTMFTVIAVSKPFNRSSNIYNTLAFSAFVLLLIDPYLIVSVSFQLSYLALLGILYFEPRIYNLWEPSTWLVDKVWQASAVSIAAQLVTFPISILYFHKFPLYFLFANLLVIPASFVVLIGGIVLLLVQFISPIAKLVGWLLGFIIKWMNTFIGFVDSLPYNSIDNLSITVTQYWMLMLLMLFVILMVRQRSFVYAVGMVLSVIVFLWQQWDRRFSDFSTSAITVYNIPHHSAIDLFCNGTVCYWFDTTLVADQKRISYSIIPNRINHGITNLYNITTTSLTKTIPGAQVVCYKGKYILRVVDDTLQVPLNLPVFDYCIVSNNCIRSPSVLMRVKFKKLIIDSSNSKKYAEMLIEKCQLHNIEVYSVPHLGAFKEVL